MNGYPIAKSRSDAPCAITQISTSPNDHAKLVWKGLLMNPLSKCDRPQISANNTRYFKVWNADLRMGGAINKLDSAEFKTYMILQSYSDEQGYIETSTGKPYTQRELAEMIGGADRRTIKVALVGLENKGMIYIDPADGYIFLPHFLENQLYRDNNNQRSTIAKRQAALDRHEIKKSLTDIQEHTSKPIIVQSNTGEILNTGAKQCR